jgi:hypothetical protein
MFKGREVSRVDIPGQYSVVIETARAREFIVRYGMETFGPASWIECAHRFGECVFHALECKGIER